jgi:GGDEF domain-containing protein
MESKAVVVSIIGSILTAMNKPISAGEYLLHVGISIGCAHHPCDGTEIADLLRHADAAMYQAKQSKSKSGYAFYSAPPSIEADSKKSANRN